MAKRFKGGGMETAIAKELNKKINRAIATGIQAAAINVMNGLAQAGPASSGEFSSSWRFVPQGQAGSGSGKAGSVYVYSKKDIRVTTVEKYINSGVKRFYFDNVSDHANIAIDLEPAIYVNNPDPLKPVEIVGYRPTDLNGLQMPTLRGDLQSASFQDGNEGTATAPLDWYITYTQGGEFSSDFGRGFSAGFVGQF